MHWSYISLALTHQIVVLTLLNLFRKRKYVFAFNTKLWSWNFISSCDSLLKKMRVWVTKPITPVTVFCQLFRSVDYLLNVLFIFDGCSDTCQIWMWISKNLSGTLAKWKNFQYPTLDHSHLSCQYHGYWRLGDTRHHIDLLDIQEIFPCLCR